MNYIRRMLSFRLAHPTLSGLWYSFLWMMIGALLLSLFIQYGIIEETNLTVYIYVIHAVAALFGGFISGKRAGRKGLYQGLITGLLYGVLILVISFLALDASLSLSELLLIIPSFIIGALGGAVGVNLTNRRS